MELYQNKHMQEKELFLKKIFNFLLTIIVVIPICMTGFAKEVDKDLKIKILNEILKLQELSSNFIQTDGATLEEGKIFIKNKRIRIDYNKPSKIRFIITKSKGMYYNIDTEEVSYFSPKENIASIIYSLFYNKDFLIEAKFKLDENFIVIERKILIDDQIKILKIFFENSPLLFRKIKIEDENNFLQLTLFNIIFEPNLEKGFFSLANPLLLKN